MIIRPSVFSMPQQAGFTLLEVMISSVILTVSLLGVAGMYGFAAKFAYEARQQTHAVYMANDILEGLRMNKRIWLTSVLMSRDNQYQLSLETNKKTSLFFECSLSNTSNHACRSNNLLHVIVAHWQQHLDAAFSAGSASACLMLQHQNAQVMDVKVTINWFVKNAVSSAIPVLDAACGDAGIGRRQFMVQTLL